MTCKGIKREATCGFSFDFRSSQASKRNDEKNFPEHTREVLNNHWILPPFGAQDDNSNDQ